MTNGLSVVAVVYTESNKEVLQICTRTCCLIACYGNLLIAILDDNIAHKVLRDSDILNAITYAALLSVVPKRIVLAAVPKGV